MGAVAFNAWSFAQALDLVIGIDGLSSEPVRDRLGVAVHFANAYNIALAETDDEYRSLLDDSDFIFIDGMPVVWAARLVSRGNRRTWARIYGPNFMRAVLTKSREQHRHFLLGGTQRSLERLKVEVARLYPGAHIVGTYSPPFSDEPSQIELDQRDKLIAEFAPTHIWVGLGTPKQDYEVIRLARTHRAACLAVGAAFDYLSNDAKEAPRLLQRLGLQWLHRLANEPRRLARRYVWGNPVFVKSVVLGVLREHVQGSRN